jgi:hypothetical protein
MDLTVSYMNSMVMIFAAYYINICIARNETSNKQMPDTITQIKLKHLTLQYSRMLIPVMGANLIQVPQ